MCASSLVYIHLYRIGISDDCHDSIIACAKLIRQCMERHLRLSSILVLETYTLDYEPREICFRKPMVMEI